LELAAQIDRRVGAIRSLQMIGVDPLPIVALGLPWDALPRRDELEVRLCALAGGGFGAAPPRAAAYEEERQQVMRLSRLRLRLIDTSQTPGGIGGMWDTCVRGPVIGVVFAFGADVDAPGV